MTQISASQRTFTRTYQIQQNRFISPFVLCDTSGGVLNCNYFEVAVTCTSSVYALQPPTVLFISPISGNFSVTTSLSGVSSFSSTYSSLTSESPFGICLPVVSGTTKYAYFGMPGEFFNSLTFRTFTSQVVGTGAVAVRLSITYGNLLPDNSIKLEDNYLYPLGR